MSMSSAEDVWHELQDCCFEYHGKPTGKHDLVNSATWYPHRRQQLCLHGSC